MIKLHGKHFLLALILTLGLGSGIAAAYDSCTACPPSVVVVKRQRVRPVRGRCGSRPCYTPTRTVYRSAPRVIYTEEVVTTRSVVSTCSVCP